MTAQDMVREFHEAFNLVVRDAPIERLRWRERALREKLHREEHNELCAALEFGDVRAVAQELADVIYVAYGTALHYGIDLDAVIAEVHRSNMSKLGQYGEPTYRTDGKVLKGPNYQPPDVAKVLGL